MSRNQILAISNALYKVAAQKYGIKKAPVAGIPLPSTYVPVLNTIMNNIVDLDAVTEGLQLEKNKVASSNSNKDAGEVVQFSDNVESHKLLTAESVRDTQVFISPGLEGGSSVKRLYNTYKEFKRLFPKVNCAVYSPLDDGNNSARRYFNGMEYYINEGVINTAESQNFLNKVILPKILDKNEDLIKPEECGKIMMANFSIGCREARSHVRYFANYLRHRDVEEEDVKKYLDLVGVLNVASPINWSGGAFDSAASVNLVSLTDMGNKKPVDFFKAIYCNEKLFEPKVSKFFRLSSLEFLLVAGPNIIPNGGVDQSGSFIPNPSGHSLHQYIDGILGDRDLSRVVDQFNDFANPATSSVEASTKLKKSLKQEFDRSKAQKYLDSAEEVSEIGLEALIETLHSYVLKEEEALKVSMGKSSNWIQDDHTPPCLIFGSPPSTTTHKKSASKVVSAKDPLGVEHA